MKLGMCSALLIGSLVGTGDLAAYASSDEIHNKVAQQVESLFKDVGKDSYAFDAIVWGKSKGLISGYPNGLFGPNDNVTEAQFVKMVSNYLGLKDTAGNLSKNKGSGAHWSDSHYDAMAKHGVPLNGYFDNTIRNNPMKRGSVAQVFGYLLGDTLELNDSINYLLSTGVTSGQNPQYEGKDLNKFFGTTNNLTRGQVITFLYRMDSKNLNNLSSLADMSASDSNNLNVKAKEGYSYVDVSLGGSKTNNNTNTNNNAVNKGGSLKDTATYVPGDKPPVENVETNSDFSSAKLPVKAGTSTKKVNINTLNKVASSMSDSTINKIKNNGYEVVETDSDFVVAIKSSNNFINIYNKTSSFKGSLKYNKGTDANLIVELVKDLYGITIPKNEVFTFGKGDIIKSTYLVEDFGSNFTVRIGDFRPN